MAWEGQFLWCLQEDRTHRGEAGWTRCMRTCPTDKWHKKSSKEGTEQRRGLICCPFLFLSHRTLQWQLAFRQRIITSNLIFLCCLFFKRNAAKLKPFITSLRRMKEIWLTFWWKELRYRAPTSVLKSSLCVSLYRIRVSSLIPNFQLNKIYFLGG